MSCIKTICSTPFPSPPNPSGHTYSWPNVPGPKRQTVGWMPRCPATKAWRLAVRLAQVCAGCARKKLHDCFWAGTLGWLYNLMVHGMINFCRYMGWLIIACFLGSCIFTFYFVVAVLTSMFQTVTAMAMKTEEVLRLRKSFVSGGGSLHNGAPCEFSQFGKPVNHHHNYPP